MTDFNAEQLAAINAHEGVYVDVAGPGSGKCLGHGTPVLLYDGRILPVEDIRQGDLLMGPDSSPRTVLSTTDGAGEMYKIIPTKGEWFVCNDDHILVVERKKRGTHTDEVSVKDYLGWTPAKQFRSKLCRTGIDFKNSTPIDLDPYFFGIWLGDGGSDLDGVSLTIADYDHEVIEHLKVIAQSYKLTLKESFNSEHSKSFDLSSGKSHPGCRLAGRNSLLTLLQRTLAGNKKHIPHAFKTASRANRLDLLAGILDADGHLSNGCCDFVQVSEQLARDVVFLARSLGLAAYIKPCKKTCCNNGVVGDYWRVSISGDLSIVPFKIRRKQPSPRRQIKDVLRTGFTVKSLGMGRYFGFEIDGDGRFLLGDFTITHNTTVLLERYRRLLMAGIPSQDILNLTFTNSAAKEMVSRVGLLGAEDVFKTFHAFALKVMQTEREHVPFKMIDTIVPFEMQDYGLLFKLVKEYPGIKNFNELKEKISAWKRDNVEPEQATKEAGGMDYFYALAYRDYEKECREEGWLDFDSLMRETVRLFETRSDVLARWKRKFISVDECQDTDVVQFRLLQLIFDGNIFVVGDENQLIYEWRSAQAGNLTNFEKKFPGAKKLFMGQNYRSTGALVAFFKKILPVDNGLASHMTTTNEWGTDPTFTKYADDFDEAQAVLASITDPQHSAVIARTNRQLFTYQKICTMRGTKYKILGKKDFWEQNEVKKLLSLAKGSTSRAPACTVLKELIDSHGLVHKYRHAETKDSNPVENLNDIVKMAANKGTILEFLTYLNKLTHARKGTKGLTLSTVHQAKGREWDHVFVVGAHQGTMPHKDGEIAEEKRIFFVACSRAGKTLAISWFKNNSEFIDEFKKDFRDLTGDDYDSDDEFKPKY